MPSPLELAEALILAGEMDDALDALSQHLTENPDDEDARRLRVRLLLSLQRGKDALADLDALPAPDQVLAAQAYALLGDDARAVEAREQLLQAGADENPEQIELLLRDLYQRKEIDKALGRLADLDKTWRWLGWSGDFFVLRADYAIAAEHYCSALDELKQQETNAILETQTAYLLLKRADVYRRLRQFAEADADYRAAEAIIPTDPMIPFNRGLLIFEQGSLRRALPLCRDALDHAPDALREHMRNTLLDEPRYHLLAQALLS
jgi:tetratricopeptide (TPR) repeat protein